MQNSSISCGLHSSTLVTLPISFRWKPAKVFLPKAKEKNVQKKVVRFSTITSKFELNPLPYPLESLEPHMSRETLEYHWGRHQRSHVENLNKLVEGTPQLDGMELEDIIISSYNKGNIILPSFNHAAQIWNHNFFWQSMKPGGGGRPTGTLLELIERDFGSFERMLKEFKDAASTQFGSGWAWLVYKANKLDVGNAENPRPSEEDNKLVIAKSPNAVNPLVWDYSPLLTIDVWEHAYYLDHENRRADYISVFMENLVSWEIVSLRLKMAMAQAASRARHDEESEKEEMPQSEATEMYLDSESDDSEAD